MKNRFILALGLVSLFVVSSCGEAKKDVSIFIYDSSDTFINGLTKDIKAKLTSNDRSYVTYDASRSQRVQNDQIISAIDSDTSSMMAVNLVDRLSASSIIEKTMSKNKKLVFFNRQPLNEDIKGTDVYYVGSDPANEGRLQGQMAAELFGDPNNLDTKYDKNGDGTIQVFMFKGELGHQDTENRSKYCIEYLKDNGYKVEIINSCYCNWLREKAYEAMKSNYKEYYSSIELMFSNNDDMALGALDYLSETSDFSPLEDITSQPFPVIGVDGTNVGLEAIKNNMMYGTVKNDSAAQADAISSFVEYFESGKTIDNEFPYTINNLNCVYVSGSKITLSNLSQFTK